VTADVYVDGKLVQRDVDRIEVTVPLRADRPVELRVEAAGYQPWGLAIRGGGKDKRIEGPVRMVGRPGANDIRCDKGNQTGAASCRAQEGSADHIELMRKGQERLPEHVTISVWRTVALPYP
jgi:hypothetical protein